MEFLNQFSKQISELFRSMTPGSRIVTGLLLALVIVGVFFLFSGKVTQSGQYLFSGKRFDPDQIHAMEGAFGTAGLSDFEVVGSQIKIKGSQADYLAALVKYKAMPAGCYNALREAANDMSYFDLPSKCNLLVQTASSEQVSQMISKMNKIEWAQAMCFRKTNRSFLSKGEDCSATIMVGTVLGEGMTTNLAKSIQQTAAGALGMSPTDITVTDARTGRDFSGNLSGGDIADNQLKSEYEAQWVEKIRDLWPIPGMTVAVNVELDPYKSRSETIVAPDKKPVTKTSYSKTKTVDRKAPAPGGRPGFASNQPNRLVQTANHMSTDVEDNSENLNDNVVGGRNEAREYAPGRPQQVNVSILIPTDYFVKIWKGQNPTPEGEEPQTPTAAQRDAIAQEKITNVKQSVANLLSDGGVEDSAKHVNVATIDSLALPPIETPGIMTTATVWLGKYWMVLGLLALGFFSLRMLRGAMRAAPVEIAESEKTGGTSKKETNETTKEAATEMLHRFEGTGPSLRDELSMLVNQDSDAAVTILRSWVGNPNSK